MDMSNLSMTSVVGALNAIGSDLQNSLNEMRIFCGQLTAQS
jgi:hypothetical protein